MRVNQLLPTLWIEDAIGEEVVALKKLLRSWGLEAEIFAERWHPALAGQARSYSECRADHETGSIYHYSCAHAEMSQLFLDMPGKKVLLYHNITPHQFFAGINPGFYELTKNGRASLGMFRDRVDLALGDSAYNCAELAALGYRQPRVLPILLDLQKFADTPPCPWTRQPFEDGWTNFLFVGRFVPNKRQEDVVRAFAHYNRYVDRHSRLFLVGKWMGLDNYLARLRQVIRSLEVEEQVFLTGEVTFPQLLAYYKMAHVFLCMSEHEGFCVPLVEAMLNDVPVLAYAAAAVPDTLGRAGVQVHEKDFPVIAEWAALLTGDDEFRRRVVAGQRARAQDFRPEIVGGRLRTYLSEVIAA